MMCTIKSVTLASAALHTLSISVLPQAVAKNKIKTEEFYSISSATFLNLTLPYPSVAASLRCHKLMGCSVLDSEKMVG